MEQAGTVLTPKGRALYGSQLTEARQQVRPAANGLNAAEYMAALQVTFVQFPNSWEAMRALSLGYVCYSQVHKQAYPSADVVATASIDDLVRGGILQWDPIVFAEVRPVSAASIFQSSLDEDEAQTFVESPNQMAFDRDLGCV